MKIMDNQKTNNVKKNNNPYIEALHGRIFTIPNILCFIRILLIPPFVVFFLNKNYVWACAMVVASGLSDCFDGFIARTFNQESELGKLLDPLADKLTLLAVGICLCFIQPYLIPVISILITKDTLMLIGSSKVIKLGILIPKAKWYGKLGTILFYLTVAFIVFVEVVNSTTDPLVYIPKDIGMTISYVLLILTAIMMVFAFVMYAITYKKLISQAGSSNK